MVTCFDKNSGFWCVLISMGFYEHWTSCKLTFLGGVWWKKKQLAEKGKGRPSIKNKNIRKQTGLISFTSRQNVVTSSAKLPHKVFNKVRVTIHTHIITLCECYDVCVQAWAWLGRERKEYGRGNKKKKEKVSLQVKRLPFPFETVGLWGQPLPPY